MNILIIGCRRVGANLARELDLEGHDVSVLDESEANLDLLDSFAGYTFNGMRFTGIPIDVDVLRSAGIENVDAVACVTADDNINLMACQIAKDVFEVPVSVCRVSDPALKDVYCGQFGLLVVCQTNLTVDAVKSNLLEDNDTISVTFGSSTAGFRMEDVPPRYVGELIDTIPLVKGKSLLGVLRKNQTLDLFGHAHSRLSAEDKLVWTELLD